MKFYKNLKEALEFELSHSDEKDGRAVIVSPKRQLELYEHSNYEVGRHICDYAYGKNNWSYIDCNEVPSVNCMPLQYGHAYFIDKKTNLVLIRYEFEYDFLYIYPTILNGERIKKIG